MNIYWYTTEELGTISPTDFLTVAEVSVQLVGNKVVEISTGSSSSGVLKAAAANVVLRRKVTLEVTPDDSSYRYRALMQNPTLVLKFSLPEYVEIPVGAWCVFQGQVFTLNYPQNFKKQGTRNIEYNLTMGTLQDGMAMYKMRNSVDGRLAWSMCAKPSEFLDEIVKNLNMRDGEGVWSADPDCIDANEKTIEFNHTSVAQALSSVATEFETEYEISEDYVISLHKVEYHKDEPIPLAYGKGNGFVPGVGRSTQSEETPVKRVYTQGTEQNIDRSLNYPSLYGATEQEGDITIAQLRLPSAQSIVYDGEHFDSDTDDDGNKYTLNSETSRTYTTDREGYYIERTDVVSDAVREDSLDCSEIYPSFYGKVYEVMLGSESNAETEHFYDFTNDQNKAAIPDTLNFNDYIIAGEKMTLIFQSGMLAGKEFEATYDHTNRKWKLVPQEIDGILMPDPDTGYMPAYGDSYGVFGIMLPSDYICNNTDKSGAAWDMFRAAAKHLYENEEQKFTFTGELQAKWAKQHWTDLALGDKLRLGAYVKFTDTQFCPDGELIRIMGIKELLNSPYSPTIEISNSVASGSSVSSKLSNIENFEVVVADSENKVIGYTKRRFRDAKETLDMLVGLDLEGFDALISPIAVQTMAMLVGDESLQFIFVDSSGNTVEDNITVKDGHLIIGECYLQHMTLDVDAITSNDGRDNSEVTTYRKWRMSAYDSGYLDPATYGKMYVYAYCNKSVGYGGFVISSTSYPLNGGTGGTHPASYNYYFLVGVLNSEYDGERSFVSLHGFTEILPGRITTDKLVSSDGESFLKLSTGEMKLGSCLEYTNDTLTLKFLFAENANIGGWIFRNNTLISQVGKVLGLSAEYTDVDEGGKYEGEEFVPNIMLDAVAGRISQGKNFHFDENGLCMLNDDGEVCMQITNSTIGDIEEAADAADTVKYGISHTISAVYVPYSGDTYSIKNQLIAEIDLGTLTAGSTVNIQNMKLYFMVPNRAGGTTTTANRLTLQAYQAVISLYQGNTKICDLGSTSFKSTGVYSGSYATLEASAGSAKTITTAGAYTIRVYLRTDYYTDTSGEYGSIEFNSSYNYITYSYSKYGYKRTVLGNDGFYASWAANQYIVATESGIRLRHGDAMIVLNSTGLQMSTTGPTGLKTQSV